MGHNIDRHISRARIMISWLIGWLIAAKVVCYGVCLLTSRVLSLVSKSRAHLSSGNMTLVSCPVRGHLQWETVWGTKSNFFVVFHKSGKDQWDCKINNYYVALSVIISTWASVPFFFWVGLAWMFWTLLGDNVAKACASPRNSTWLTRPFLLMRGWGLGTRL